MKVVLDTELWIYTLEDGSLTLDRPAIIANGKGAPGLMVPQPMVLHPGTVIYLKVRRT